MKSGFCDKCAHFKKCDTPCRPVEIFLKKNNLDVFEKNFTNAEGKSISIIFSRSREVPESALPEIDQDADPIFSNENENPFKSFDPHLKQTGIFIDRFFLKFNYQDLAVKYKISTTAAHKIYHAALNRILAVLDAMDTGKTKQVDFYKKQVQERSGKFPKGQKWYLLNKLFGLMPSEIAEMEGMKGSSSVRQLIIRVSDQLQAGEIHLIETSPEQTKEAKARLDTHRKKRRERYKKNSRS